MFDDNEELNQEPVEEQQPEAELQEQEEQLHEETAPVKEKAKKFGYLTKDEYLEKHGNLDGFKSEEEFVEYGDSYSKLKPVLDSLKKTIHKQNDEIESLVKYQERHIERERAKVKSEFEARLKQAKLEGNTDAVEQLAYDKQKFELDDARTKENTLAAERRRADEQFIAANQHWFNDQHPELMQDAIARGNKIMTRSPNLPYEEVVKEVQEYMELKHPDIVSNTPRQSPVIRSERSQVAKVASTSTIQNEDKAFNTLDTELKNVYSATKRMVEKATGKEYTKKMFINQLRKDGEIQ